MIVFGDVRQCTAAASKLRLVRESLLRMSSEDTWIDHHTCLVAAFVDLGEFAQGQADLASRARGDVDDLGKDGCEYMAVLQGFAAAIARSWLDGSRVDPRDLLAELAALDGDACDLPCVHAEGYAFYALYPEAFLVAARLSGLSGGVVLGLRSIGTGLAAMVGQGLGADIVATVRPGGPPFARRVRLGPALAAEIAAASGVVAIVDEGPGLSGSSLGATADAVEALGVETSRIHMFPGHAGALGYAASDAHVARWRTVAKHVTSFDDLAGPGAAEPRHRVTTWFDAAAACRDLSGGAWRQVFDPDERAWPPAHMLFEARKFLCERDDGPFIAKFIGLGSPALDKAARARDLHAAGFCPEPIGYKHGFLGTRWLADSVPLAGSLDPRRLAAYLAFRARSFPCASAGGADLSALWDMACHNVATGLGSDAARRLQANAPHQRLAHAIRRVDTDNRLHAWEWRVTADGRVWKTDAIDHSRGHDLIGCQDIAWDVAGACREFALDETARTDLLDAMAREGCAIDPDLLAVYDICYPAFQLGYYTFAATALAGAPAEAARARQAVERYAAAFQPPVH